MNTCMKGSQNLSVIVVTRVEFQGAKNDEEKSTCFRNRFNRLQ